MIVTRAIIGAPLARALAAVAAAAGCSDPGPTLPPGDDDDDVPRTAFASPAEATDLDPDPAVLHAAFVADEAEIALDGAVWDGYAYNGQVPGPTLRLAVGDTLRVDLENRLDVETTIHWHGLELPFAMDGVTWQTSPLQPGASFTYEFVVNRPGTYWYHPHFDVDGQVDRGLYGVLIVEDPTEPALPDAVIVADLWDERGDGTIGQAHSATSERWFVNGLVEPLLTVPGGTALRMRFVNVSNGGYLRILAPGLRQIAADQGLLPAALTPAEVLLAPGDRADFEWRVGSADADAVALAYTMAGGRWAGPEQRLLTVAPEPGEPVGPPDPADWPFAPGIPSADPDHADIVYVLTGDPSTESWLINGEAYPDVTIKSAPLGADTVIEVRNLSPTEHPFHLHGMRFEVLSIDGEPSPYLRWEDTVNVPIRSVLRLRIAPAIPGDWMAHCHILPHHHEGMMTVLRVE